MCIYVCVFMQKCIHTCGLGQLSINYTQDNSNFMWKYQFLALRWYFIESKTRSYLFSHWKLRNWYLLGIFKTK